MSSHQLNSKNNVPVLLFQAIFRHRNCFMLPLAMDGKDGHGFVKTLSITFSSFNAMPAKHQKNYYQWLVLPDEVCLISALSLCRSTLCVVKGTKK